MRIIFASAEHLSSSITLKPSHTLSINSARIEVLQHPTVVGTNRIKYTITATAGDDAIVALDFNFMGNSFEVENTDGLQLFADELCMDLRNESRSVTFWVSVK
ncbi:hypothetical protein AB4455_12495 [Vibrio sp. 10N.261.46.E12]|uniref:hypothetical protein n=1 Tax=unclassified Vibrio TaxID=2614977 RepID=UPI001056A807|nr:MULTISPECIES: hypothetical protein [unclassified Vibrio]